ncbi:MAG TPA: TonB-dependent receptor plug domain-containing protein [Gemmatimonadaceae bacterium]|nr:TonB-dependent receptor plug domain-containing protein [Gemmatimonadaceae bacterium]
MLFVHCLLFLQAAHLDTVVTRGRSDNLVGIAASSNQGSVGEADLALRPLLRPGEIVENIPGVIVTQHSGSGKANQYFLRGFNLDHGTDLALSVDGVPINMPTHAHGQGYADLNFVIPELIERVNFKKGPYYADVGDFGSAGAFDIQYYDRLPNGIARLDGGQGSYERAVVANNAGNVLYAGEFEHNDGPWAIGDDERKFDGVLRYATGDARNGFVLTGMGYHNDWHSTDQLPDRALTEGLVSRFGDIDSTDAGNTGRYSLTADWHATNGHSKSRVVFYALHYDLDLFSDFTYFLNDPVRGDQIEQRDVRTVTGVRVMHTEFGTLFGVPTRNTFGLDVRYDNIDNGLYHTERRVRLGAVTVNNTNEVGGAPYVENTLFWLPWLRTVVGLRGDLLGINGLFSPKANVTFGPWAKTEFYVDAGDGFHSNDARDRATPMARSTGAEVGARSAIVPGLQSSVSLWLLDLQSELVWDGDAGTNVPSGPTRRYGIEFANYYTPVRWLTIDADYAWSHARFRDRESAGEFVPEALVSTFDGGLALHDLAHALRSWDAGVRFRYFGPRPLTQDGTVHSKATSLLYADVGYEFARTRLSLAVFNILSTTASDIDYYYISRLKGEPLSGVGDVHSHPSEPRTLRGSVTVRF